MYGGIPNMPKHHKKASIKQITALKLMNETDPETGKMYTKRKAMLRAGYSKKMANNPKHLMQSQAIVSIVDKFHLELKDAGITTAYLANKYAEWLDASEPIRGIGGVVRDPDTKEIIMKPLYQIQIEAGKLLRDVYSLTPQKEDKEKPVKSISLEDFVFSDKDKAIEGEVIEDSKQEQIKEEREEE